MVGPGENFLNESSQRLENAIFRLVFANAENSSFSHAFF